MMECMKELGDKLHSMGLDKGDMLYVGSDVLYLLYEAREKYNVESPEEQDAFLSQLVDGLQEAVGKEGTLMFPVFTWEFCRGHGHDVRKTRGETGALGNFVLENRIDFQRTKHPLYSFMVWGKEADKLVALENAKAWVGGTPFDYLKEKNGKMLMLHVTAQKCLTYMHYAEEVVKVPYRYTKEFHGEYTDIDGKTTERTYSQFVRDLDINMRQIMPNNFLIDNKAAVEDSWENAPIWLVNIQRACKTIEEDLLHNNGGNCYAFDDYKIDWTHGATHEDDLYANRIKTK